MTLDTIHLSQRAKEQLVSLKSKTGIQNWNILCRWAFCLSLAEPTKPSPAKIPSDSNVEMTWKVFGGKHEDVYLALLKQRCQEDFHDTSDVLLAEQFRLHLHRGIGYLFGSKNIKNIEDLFSLMVG